MKRTLFCSIALSVIWHLSALSFADHSKGTRTTAEELIAKAREAIGGEAKLKSIKSLSVTGSYRRNLGEREIGGEIEFEILLPDKIRRVETMSPVPSAEITRIDVMNGTQIWSNSQSSNTGGGMIMIRRPGADTPQGQAIADNALRADLARFLLGLLLAAPSTFPLEFTFAGEAEAPDGRADTLDVSGPNGFAARLFLDQKTHRPLMMSYKDRAQRMVFQTATGGPANREDMERRAREATAGAEAAPRVEVQLSLEDYRPVDGVMFPHSMSRMIDGKVNEEIEIKKIRINPQIKPDRFEKK